MIPVLFVIATLTFFMVRLAPGGPFTAEKSIPPEIQKKLEAFYGLNKPLYQQYLDYMGNLLKGDLGPSFKYATWSVNELIWSAFPVSLELGCYGLAIALILGLGAGILASLRQNSALDHVSKSMARFVKESRKVLAGANPRGVLYGVFELEDYLRAGADGPWHVTAIDARTGWRQWDVALQPSAAIDSAGPIACSASRVYVQRSASLDILDAETGKKLGAVE